MNSTSNDLPVPFPPIMEFSPWLKSTDCSAKKPPESVTLPILGIVVPFELEVLSNTHIRIQKTLAEAFQVDLLHFEMGGKFSNSI